MSQPFKTHHRPLVSHDDRSSWVTWMNVTLKETVGSERNTRGSLWNHCKHWGGMCWRVDQCFQEIICNQQLHSDRLRLNQTSKQINKGVFKVFLCQFWSVVWVDMRVTDNYWWMWAAHYIHMFLSLFCSFMLLLSWQWWDTDQWINSPINWSAGWLVRPMISNQCPDRQSEKSKSRWETPGGRRGRGGLVTGSSRAQQDALNYWST